eukprot:363119-Chlamydomonas_euryale.AAC.7
MPGNKCLHPMPLRQMYILDGNLYDNKFLEGGRIIEGGTEPEEELEACALMLNKKKVAGGGRAIGGAALARATFAVAGGQQAENRWDGEGVEQPAAWIGGAVGWNRAAGRCAGTPRAPEGSADSTCMRRSSGQCRQRMHAALVRAMQTAHACGAVRGCSSMSLSMSTPA